MKIIIFCLLISALIFSSTLFGQTSQNKNPKLVAQKLYQSWHLKNKKSALKVASRTAVDKLFSVRWRVMKFEGCNRRDEGGFECVYRDTKNDFSLAMIVEGGASVGSYNVASLSFSSEE